MTQLNLIHWNKSASESKFLSLQCSVETLKTVIWNCVMKMVQRITVMPHSTRVRSLCYCLCGVLCAYCFFFSSSLPLSKNMQRWIGYTKLLLGAKECVIACVPCNGTGRVCPCLTHNCSQDIRQIHHNSDQDNVLPEWIMKLTTQSLH